MKNIFYAGMLALCMMSLAACSSDEDTYDFPGDGTNRVYMTNTLKTYKIVQTPISTVSTMKFETPLKCTQKASANIKATVEVDNSMIVAYNEENGTDYEAIPEAALVIENATMNIPAGAMATVDTFRVTITEDAAIAAALRSEKGYLIPLRITTTEGGNSQPSSNYYYTYLMATVTEDNINHDAIVGNITGTLVADQSGWSATTNATVSTQQLPYLFTTATASYCYIYTTSADGIVLDVDMGQSYTFDGILFQRSVSTAVFASGMTIQTSTDGTTWKLAGTLSKASTFCAFYAPLTARYIRIVKPKTSTTTYFYASRFNVYEK